jgi:hypothetical protein
VRILPGKAAIVPPPEPPWLVEPEEQTGMMVPVAEVTMFERHMAEPEHDIVVAELEHQPALAEMAEVSRLEPWEMSELGRETTVAEVPEVTRFERTMLSADATVVELEAVVAQVQLRASVP